MLAIASVLLHPGHGSTEPSSWLHYLTEPTHVLSLTLAVGASVAIALLRRRSARRND